MNPPESKAPPSLVLRNGTILTPEGTQQALSIEGNVLATLGSEAAVLATATDQTRIIDLRGRTVIAGLIDGHAHMDREGLKTTLPSLAGATCIDDILARIEQLVRGKSPGEWVVTMPIGNPPAYENELAGLREGRYPTRAELDSVSPNNPVYIRSIWGYWRTTLPLVSMANSEALRLAGIDKNTVSPVESVEICRDEASGEPTGVFRDWNKMPVVELSLMRVAPNFSVSERTQALVASMQAYNQAGTTSVFEGHGVSTEVLAAFRALHGAQRQTVRASLVFSPAWQTTSAADCQALLHSWGHWLAGKGLGDEWLSMRGIYAEVDDTPERALRSAMFPQTGWAGFHYNSSLPREVLRDLLIEASRQGIRAVGILPDMLQMFRDVDKVAPLAGQRWVLGHIGALSPPDIGSIVDMGLLVTTHTSSNLYRRGADLLKTLGAERANDIVPLRSLLDAGVPVSLGSDNVPLNLFHSISHIVNRRDRHGTLIGADQAISREEALTCATHGGAWLTFEETRKGQLRTGMLADLAVLSHDPLSCDASSLSKIHADMTIVNGRIVFEKP